MGGGPSEGNPTPNMTIAPTTTAEGGGAHQSRSVINPTHRVECVDVPIGGPDAPTPY
jgi:Ni,Fe-hydrogenase III small subunit